MKNIFVKLVLISVFLMAFAACSSQEETKGEKILRADPGKKTVEVKENDKLVRQENEEQEGKGALVVDLPENVSVSRQWTLTEEPNFEGDFGETVVIDRNIPVRKVPLADVSGLIGESASEDIYVSFVDESKRCTDDEYQEILGISKYCPKQDYVESVRTVKEDPVEGYIERLDVEGHGLQGYVESLRVYGHGEEGYIESLDVYGHGEQGYIESLGVYGHGVQSYVDAVKVRAHAAGGYIEALGVGGHGAQGYIETVY